MYGTMDGNKVEYSVQPAYNDSFLHTCPPSYSDAAASHFNNSQSVSQYPRPQQPVYKPVIPSAPVNGVSSFEQQILQLPVSVGPEKTTLNCPNCHRLVCTKVKTGYQKSAHCACFFLCIIGCFLCSCIPYCLRPFKNVHHHCPLCKVYIGTYRG